MPSADAGKAETLRGLSDEEGQHETLVALSLQREISPCFSESYSFLCDPGGGLEQESTHTVLISLIRKERRCPRT